MKMNKRLLSRLMHERVNGLLSSRGYFFRSDFEYILQGVVLEYVPRGLYIWNFRFPLFDLTGPHLTYSNRLPERPFIGKGEMSEEAIVDHVMASPEVRQTFDADVPMSLLEFDQYLFESNQFLNPHAKLVHAEALVLLGQESRAADLLDELPPILHPKDIPHCNQLRASLRQGHEAARMLLDQARRENLRTLGVAQP
jgi:hypothetical protein